MISKIAAYSFNPNQLMLHVACQYVEELEQSSSKQKTKSDTLHITPV